MNNILKFKMFDKYEFVNSGFSTRLGGVSEGQFSSMNLRFNSNDAQENIEKNYQIFLDEFDLTLEKVIFANQIHEDEIMIVEDLDIKASGMDGLVTNKKDIGLITFHADCFSVFFLDPVEKVVGVLHSGWRGTLLNISKNMIDIFRNKYNSELENILVGIGPGAGKCCYEVGNDVYGHFLEKNVELHKYFKPIGSKYLCDLQGIIEYSLISEGISEQNIEKIDLCTMCNSDLFFSHRIQGSERGTMVALMGLK